MKRVCTIEASFQLQNKRIKLSELYLLATGEELVDAHRAGNDVRATIAVYKYLREKGLA